MNDMKGQGLQASELCSWIPLFSYLLFPLKSNCFEHQKWLQKITLSKAASASRCEEEHSLKMLYALPGSYSVVANFRKHKLPIISEEGIFFWPAVLKVDAFPIDFRTAST